MRGSRFVPLLVVVAAVVVAVGAVIAGQGLRAGLAGSSGQTTYPLGGTIAIILVAALATLPLVLLLAYLRRRPLLGPRLARSPGGRRFAFGLSALLIVFPVAPFLLGELRLDGPVRMAAIIMTLGFVAYALGVNRLVRWLDARLPHRTPAR